MKKYLATAVIAVFVLSSCLKQDSKCGYPDSSVTAPEDQINNLEDSLAKYGISGAQVSPSGFMYKIINQGSGPSVTNLCSAITVTYKGRFFNGKIFDETKFDSTNNIPMPVYFELGGVILGWQKGIPLINQGGKIDLYIPPSLGYGPNDKTDNYGKVIMPGNSYLVFEVEVLRID